MQLNILITNNYRLFSVNIPNTVRVKKKHYIHVTNWSALTPYFYKFSFCTHPKHRNKILFFESTSCCPSRDIPSYSTKPWRDASVVQVWSLVVTPNTPRSRLVLQCSGSGIYAPLILFFLVIDGTPRIALELKMQRA